MYELLITTLHCMGRMKHVVGKTDTEAEARAWVGNVDGDHLDRPRVPSDDPVAWCPVRHCHMKRQKGVRSYQKNSI